MQERVFKKNEVIFWEGAVGSCFYKILDGTVAVVLNYGTSDEKKLTELGPGKIFGEMSVLEVWTRSATVVAMQDDVRALEINSSEVGELFEEDPEMIKLILRNLSRRLRELTGDYTDVCNTISEMRSTKGQAGRRKEGLLARISKFLSVSSHVLGNKSVLEAMENYEFIEQSKEDVGQTRENLRFKKGQVIFRQGDPGDCMYYIAYGTVGIYIDFGTEKENLLTKLHENQFFGEMGMIEKMARSATAVVLENDTVLTSFTEEGLDRMFEEKPSLILLSLQHISSRLRKLTRDYMKACQTVARMIEDEKGNEPLTEEDEEMIRYYISMAQAQNNYWTWY